MEGNPVSLKKACIIILLLIPTSPFAYDRDLWQSFPSMNYVTSLVESPTVIFVATTGGIRRYDRFARTWLAPLTTLDGLPDNRVQRITYDPDTGDLWFETPSGTGRWLTGIQSVMPGGVIPGHLNKPRPTPKIPPVFPPFGYYIDDRKIIGPRNNYAITNVLIDSWRHLWIATWGLGVGRAELIDGQLTFLTFGPLEENVTAIARDGDTIWIGGEDTYRAPVRGITRYHPNANTWEYFEADRIIGLDDPQVVSILPDSVNVWFGTHNGLMRYHKRTGQWFTYRDTRRWGSVQALARDDNTLWIGSERGLALLDTKTDSLDRVSGSERAIIQALVAGPDYIWAGTQTGLYQTARGDRTWRAVKDAQNFAKRPVRALTIYDNDLWIATETPPGLLRYRLKDNTWYEFPLAEIGGRDRISIDADSTSIWVATGAGAFYLDVARQHWTHYTTFDGLIHTRIQIVMRDDEHVWFGTPEGLSRFHWVRAIFEKN
jgi:ligand-binding sensor domain-containing protein